MTPLDASSEPPALAPTGMVRRPRPWLDMAGVFVAVACGVHCAASGLFFAAVALVGMTSPDAPYLEWGFLGATTVLGGWSLGSGWRRHRDHVPLVLFLTGVALLLVARTLGDSSRMEGIPVVIGATTVSLAHLRNWWLVRRVGCALCESGGR